MHSQALRMLYDEHDVILEALEQVKTILESPTLPLRGEALRWYLDFFQQYGDLYHHHKEEEILFSLLGQKDLLLAGSMVQALTEHHQMFREDLRQARQALVQQDWPLVKSILGQYFSHLRDHISAENDELFVTAGQLLNEAEKETLYFSFLDKDRQLGEEKKQALEKQIRNPN